MREVSAFLTSTDGFANQAMGLRVSLVCPALLQDKVANMGEYPSVIWAV